MGFELGVGEPGAPATAGRGPLLLLLETREEDGASKLQLPSARAFQ